MTDGIACSFCGRPKADEPYVSGPGVAICPACVGRLLALGAGLDGPAPASRAPEGGRSWVGVRCPFCGAVAGDPEAEFAHVPAGDAQAVCVRCLDLVAEILTEGDVAAGLDAHERAALRRGRALLRAQHQQLYARWR